MNQTLATRNPQAVTRHPFRGLFRHPLLDDMFDQLFTTNGGGGMDEMMKVSMDVAETDTAFEVTVDLPGIKQNDVDIQIDHNTLTIRGERSEQKEEQEKQYHRVERYSGSFCRSIVLPDTVNEDEASADYKDGVLKIVMPKSDAAKPRKIKISS